MKKIEPIDTSRYQYAELEDMVYDCMDRINELVHAVNSLIGTSQFEKEVTKAGHTHNGKTPFPEDSV